MGLSTNEMFIYPLVVKMQELSSDYWYEMQEYQRIGTSGTTLGVRYVIFNLGPNN